METNPAAVMSTADAGIACRMTRQNDAPVGTGPIGVVKIEPALMIVVPGTGGRNRYRNRQRNHDADHCRPRSEAIATWGENRIAEHRGGAACRSPRLHSATDPPGADPNSVTTFSS